MPIIPALVCMSTGCVAQRHMKAPGCLATKRIVMRLPGATSMQFLLGVRQLIDRIREHVRIWLR